MILYSHTRSPWCRKVDWALAEMNMASKLKVEVIGLNGADTAAGIAQMKAACGSLATLPALKNNDFILCESSAIVSYLVDELDYSGTFYPRSFKDRALLLQWDRIADINLGANVLSPWLRNTVFLGGKTPDEAAFEKARENFLKLEERLVAQLNHSNYLAGDAFTFADVSMAHLLTQLQSVGGPVLQNEKAKSWLQNCNSRKAYVNLSERNG